MKDCPRVYSSTGCECLMEVACLFLAVAVKLIPTALFMQTYRPVSDHPGKHWLLGKSVYSAIGWQVGCCRLTGVASMELAANRYTVLHHKPPCDCFGS